MVTSAPCSAPCSPHYSILGRISDTDVYRDVAEYQMVTAPGGWEKSCLQWGGSSKHLQGLFAGERRGGGHFGGGREGKQGTPFLG